MVVSPRSRLPIGVSDFREMRAPGVLYVDKTDFVTQVLTSLAKVELFPRPRRFGKTVNLSTLRYFVEKTGEDRTALFEGLSVWRSAEARACFQRFPVISLTFKDVKAGRFAEAFAAIREELRRAYRQHLYLLEEGFLGPDEAQRFRQVLHAEGPVSLYAAALLDLSSSLARYHGEQVVLLVDEYDTPIHAAASPDDEAEILDFLRVFFSGGLKDNPHLYKGVVTGILRVARESLFSGLNNLAVYSILRSEHAASFGFTEDEVRDLAESTGAATSFADLESWYDGYRFGGRVIYNPWSVLNFLASEDRVLQPYWVHTSSEDLLRRVIFQHGIGRRGELETLLQGGEIDKRIDDRVALRELGRSPEAVWSFLLFTGYLKARNVRQEDDETVATLAIPNREVMTVYRRIFRTWLDQRLGGSGEVEELLTAILAGDAQVFEAHLGQLLQSLSVHDLAVRRTSRGREKGKRTGAGSERQPSAESAPAEDDLMLTPEQVYHVFVVSLLLGLQPAYLVRSNRESGAGRYDVMISPRTPGKPGVVMELKVRNRRKKESMKAALEAAIQQLRDRDYAAELRACGADPIHEMAVVFDGKKVQVALARAPSVRRPTAKAP